MSTDNEMWEKLKDPEYRRLFVEEFAKRAFATQVRTIRKRREWSQASLAQKAGVNQGVISRTEDPNLGTTFDTAAQVVSGFDLAFIPKVVTFSEFVRWVNEVSEGYTDLPSFKEEIELFPESNKEQSLVGQPGVHGLFASSPEMAEERMESAKPNDEPILVGAPPKRPQTSGMQSARELKGA
ncbi:MAG: hypothetical protein WA738_19680 [Candidatus Angelobacter sp.]